VTLTFSARELRLSKYRLLGLVGQGQFGRVYCASHRKAGHLFALKELDRQRFPTHQFLRELRFLLSLHHPNIVACHALEHTQTTRYLVLDYCEGGTLRSVMEEVRLTPLHSLELVADVLAGLAHAHEMGIVHCDIKPENILLNLRSHGWTARISDFGIARLNQEARFHTGNTGSPAYMAPERFYGQYSYASDLYSVGILLYELLVGRRPFSGLPAELMSAHLNQPVQIPSQLPASLRALLLKPLQKLPARRFRSTLEMLEALQAVAAELRSPTRCPDPVLLRPLVSLALTPCPSLQQVSLTTPIRQLGVARSSGGRPDDPLGKQLIDRIYQVCDRAIGCQIRVTSGMDSLPSEPSSEPFSEPSTPPLEGDLASVQLPASVQRLLVSAQGCFATTRRSLYWLSSSLFQPELRAGDPRTAGDLRIGDPLRLIAEFDRDPIVTADPQGRWLVTATVDADGSSLSFWRSPTTQPHRVALAQCPHRLFQLLTLDARHLVAACHAADQNSNSWIQGIRLEVFTRRGTLVNGFSLPIPVRHLGLSYQPYRLIATEPEHPTSVLLLDLKPFRMLRLAVEIVPELIAAARWGYVLSDAAGQIVLLDRYGQAIGRLDGPAHPSAIAILEPYTLLVATWHAGQGTLHTIDLTQLDLDVVF
jgi:serine/threonine protein kinase